MSRPFYSDYVKHSLRFYSRNCSEQPSFKTDADKNNWWACDIVLRHYSEEHRSMLLSVYSGYDTLPDEVYNASKKYNVNQTIIWDLMKKVEREIARERGLL